MYNELQNKHKVINTLIKKQRYDSLHNVALIKLFLFLTEGASKWKFERGLNRGEAQRRALFQPRALRGRISRHICAPHTLRLRISTINLANRTSSIRNICLGKLTNFV